MPTSFSIKQLENTVYTLLRAHIPSPTTFPIIWANQNAPRPSTANFVELSRLNFGRVGRDFVGPVNAATGHAPTLGTREFTISIHAFGPDGEQVLEGFRAFLDTDAAVAALQLGGLTVVDSGEIVDVPKLHGQQFKDHSVMDVFFRTYAYSTDAEKDLGYIDRVDLTLETTDEAGQMSSRIIIIDTSP